MSRMPYRCMAIRSRPIPKANPLYFAGSMPHISSTLGLTMPEEYTQRMIMTGTAVEGTEDISGGMEKVVVGRVLTCTDVEGTHLHECTVDVGGPETLHIVCGAPNVAAGQLVPVALDGAHLPGGVKIKKGKLRGMISVGT